MKHIVHHTNNADIFLNESLYLKCSRMFTAFPMALQTVLHTVGLMIVVNCNLIIMLVCTLVGAVACVRVRVYLRACVCMCLRLCLQFLAANSVCLHIQNMFLQ